MSDECNRYECAKHCNMAFCEGGRNCAVHGIEDHTWWIAPILTMVVAATIIGAYLWQALT